MIDTRAEKKSIIGCEFTSLPGASFEAAESEVNLALEAAFDARLQFREQNPDVICRLNYKTRTKEVSSGWLTINLL